MYEVTDVNRRSKIGRTALMVTAAGNGDVECLKLPIKAGADLDIQDENGFTALVWAFLAFSHSCFNILLKAGAEVPLVIREILRAKQMEQQLNQKDAQGTLAMNFLKTGDEIPELKVAETSETTISNHRQRNRSTGSTVQPRNTGDGSSATL